MSYQLWQYLNVRSAIGAAISPDAGRVAFISNMPGVWQAYVMSAQGGWPHQITFFKSGAQWASWRPTGDSLLVGADADGNEKTQLWLISPEGEILRRLTDAPRVIHSFGGWSWDGKRIAFASNARDERYFDVYVADLPEGDAPFEPRMVMSTDETLGAAGFSPDGTRLLVERANTNLDADLFVVNLEDNSRTLLTEHQDEARFYAVQWAADGNKLYALTDLGGRNFVNLAEIDATTGDLKWLREDDADFEGLAVSKDGSKLAYIINRDGYSEPRLIDLTTGNETALPIEKGVIGSFSFSRDGARAALSMNTPTRPGNVYVLDLASGRTEQVTQSATAGIPQGSFSAPELIKLKSFDGLEIAGFLYQPPGEGQAPAIISVHGGPESQEKPIFNPLYQYFLANGYAIFAPNIRGSTGYGKEFTHLDDIEKRWDALKDIVACADWLKSSGRVDPKRIAVMGGSYGGFATLASLCHHPDVWAAGVDIVGISHFGTFLKNTGPWRVKLRAVEYGDPERDAEFIEAIAPLNHADKIKAPLMVVQGANDPRVPQSEADQMVEIIKRGGGDVEYLVFEDEGHGVQKLPNRIRCYEAIVAFLDRVLKA